jgi:hypothetical protein
VEWLKVEALSSNPGTQDLNEGRTNSLVDHPNYCFVGVVRRGVAHRNMTANFVVSLMEQMRG